LAEPETTRIRPSGRGRWSLSETIGVILLVIYLITAARDVVPNSGAFQWDFRVYYAAAKAMAQGLDPYLLTNVQVVADATLPYVYPPPTLWVFRPFAALGFELAYVVYFLLKVMALALLIWLWRNTFLSGSTNLLFFVLLLFAFNRALNLDITAGNITVFEQLVLWAGFAAFLRERRGWFCAAVLFVAMFKITPILFLVLLLLPRPGAQVPDRKNLAWLAGAAGAFIGINAASLLANPTAWAGYAANAREMSTETGIIAPSTFALAHSLTEFAARHGVPINHIELASWVLYAALATGLAWVGWRSISKLSRANRMVAALCLACVVFAVVVPRFKDYTYLMLIVPAFVLIELNPSVKRNLPLVLLLVLTSGAGSNGSIFQETVNLAWEYWPLLLAYGMLGLYVTEANRMRSPDLSAGTRTTP
jgi:hypothetical protein